jgi:hypothetical protein
MAQEDITTQLFADILPKTPAQEQATYQAQRDLMALKMAQLPAGAGVRFAGFQASQDLGRALGGVEKGLRQGLFGIETSKEAEDRISKEIRAGGADILKTEGLDGYLNYLSDAYGQAGLTDKATKARLIAEKLTQQQEIIKSQIDLRKAQATQLTAKAEGPTGSQALQKYRELRALGMSDVDARNAAYGIRPEKEEGVKTGFDKLGRFTNQFGEVIPASEMSANRQGFEEGEKLLRSLNQITATDVKNAEGFDYTSSEVMKQTGGRLFGKTLEAQTRIAAAQLIKQIESLPKGSASDADMRAAKASFPGYGNAQALASWVNEAKATLEYSLERQAERYGQTRKVKTTAPLDLKQPSKRETKEQPAGQPKATKRYNMQTGQLEDIQ